jgi:flagellar operon protein
MADTYINGVRVPFLPARGVDGLKDRRPLDPSEGQEFQSILEKEIRELKFSRHATERLESRNITLNERDMAGLQDAVQRAEQKGAKDSLVILRDLAFIVNIKNRMVVTAMDGERLKENVFTNIDSAVVAG